MEVTTIPLLKNLEGPWSSLQIRTSNGLISLEVYPFLSVTDLKRLIWIHFDGEPRWAPERTFVGIREPEGVRSVEFSWPGQRFLPDPLTHKEPNPALVDDAGIRKPVMPTMTGAHILESVMSPNEILDVISLDELRVTTIDDRLFGGYYQQYFPWLKSPGQVIESDRKTLEDSYSASVPYSQDRIGRIGFVNRCLATGAAGESAIMDSFVRIRWLLPIPTVKPESLEKTFYSLQATSTIPFMRYYPVKGSGAPILKLGLHPDGSPMITDPKTLSQYLGQPAPNSKGAVVVARCPLDQTDTAFTIHLFEDGTSDIRLDVPQRGMSYGFPVAVEAEKALKSLMDHMGFAPDTVATLSGIHATYKWIHPNPKKSKPLSAARLQNRVSALTPFLEQVPQLEGPLLSCQWRATSNYESESIQFQYITQLILRGQKSMDAYVSAVKTRFGLTEGVAKSTIETWLEKRAESRNTGAAIAIYASHPEYRVEIQDVTSATELQRILSVIGVVLGASDTDLVLPQPAPAVKAVTTLIEIENATVPTLDEGGEDYGDLLAELGFGLEEEPISQSVGGSGSAPAAAPAETQEEEIILDTGSALPDLTAAIAAVEDECGHNPIPSGTVLDIADDWYMVKLKRNDKTMFGYPADKTGRIKTYSKSCQRRDDRQPNIMTLTEYARVKNCYQEQVRFVDLPPQKPSDLPQDPTFSAKRRYPDEYFLVDPVSKKPMWTVYGYENKSKAGQFLYLICAELWCDYDNLPLLPKEFMGTAGRGFTKPPETCPFCGGRAIRQMDSPKAGESVIVREPKAATGKIHNFIGTMTRTQHPNGYGLPCCDTTPRLLKHFMSKGKLTPAQEEEEYAEPPEEIEEIEEKVTDYRGILHSMNKQYIIGNDKTLDAGKIALLIPKLDEFFGQQSSRALTSQGIKSVFADNVTLFVRVGVDTQVQRGRRGMNLFAGLAPLVDMENASQVLRLFLGQRNPNRLQEADDVLSRRLVRSFEGANYGALLIEFAAKDNEMPSQGVLEGFASRNGYVLDTDSRGHIIRLYRAWTAYLRYLVDPSQPKHIRHIEHMLAQPGPIVPRGLHLIVLEQEGDTVRIVCPSFGIPLAPVFGDVPISFIWHDVRDDSWEPLVLYNGTKDAVKFFGPSASLPKPVQSSITHLIRTWQSLKGCARPAPPPHVWTIDRDTSALPRLSSLLSKNPQAIIRDRSNRLAGLVFPNGCFVPCLDDGFLVEGLGRLYEIPMTPWSVYEKFYMSLAEYRGLRPVALLMRQAQIVGFKTEVGSMVPTMAEAIQSPSLPVDQLDAFPWERDAILLRAPDHVGAVISLEESTSSVQEQAEEAYQLVRLSLSRWLNRDAKGPTLRRILIGIINGSQPLYEKRKRLDLILQPKIQEWLIHTQTSERVTLPILREDCLSIPEEKCAGSCKWSGDRCLIHVPTESSNPLTMVFTARISDELLRYARQRHEIMDESVKTIREPKGAVRVGNELYLTSRTSTSEDIMERLGILGPRASMFPEEMLQFEGAEDEVIDFVDESVLGPEWLQKGFLMPTVAEDLEDPRGLLFAGVTGKSLEEWRDLLNKKRGSAKELDWSPADWQLIADIMQSNLLFVRGQSNIEAWYSPALAAKNPLVLYSVFWGPKQLLLAKGKNYRFRLSELPMSILTALDTGVQPKAEPVPSTVALPVVQPAVQLSAEPVPSAVALPVVQPAVQLSAEPVPSAVALPVESEVKIVQPAVQPAVQLSAEPVPSAVALPVVQPVVQPLAEPVPSTVALPVVQPVVQPLAEPVPSTVALPVVQPLAEQVQVEPEQAKPAQQSQQPEPVETQVEQEAVELEVKPVQVEPTQQPEQSEQVQVEPAQQPEKVQVEPSAQQPTLFGAVSDMFSALVSEPKPEQKESELDLSLNFNQDEAPPLEG